jgi:hypothetical protein
LNADCFAFNLNFSGKGDMDEHRRVEEADQDEIDAILTASSKTAKANLRKSINNQKSAINN